MADDQPPQVPPPITISLDSALPTITEGVNIDGGPIGQSRVFITRDQNAGPFRILTIDMPTTLPLQMVELRNLAITGGRAGGVVDDGNGGGIWVRGSNLLLTGTIVTNNSAIGDGGGIWAIGFNDPLRVEDVTLVTGSQILDNSAVRGGGAFVVNLYFRVFDGCSVSSNTASQSGGGIAAYAQNYTFLQLVEIKNGFVENNQARDGDGGGIYIQTLNGPKAQLFIRGAKINSNRAWGVRDALNQVQSGGRGGAIAMFAIGVTDDNLTNVANNIEGTQSLLPGVYMFLSFTPPGGLLGTYQNNTVA